MARHARLVAPPAPPRQEWPWHKVEWNSIPVARLAVSGRRFEAEGFLSSGLDLKTAVVSESSGWARLGTIADIQQPPRTKATLVSPGQGRPFLTAGQMFEIRPHVRKWLAEEYLPHPEQLYAHKGTIIVRRSADVGRMTLTLKHHEGHLISDHFFRVTPKTPASRGWLYAFLRSSQAKAMMVGAQYGHIIKHIEISHLADLPVPKVDAAMAADFDQCVARLLELRDRSYRHMLEAEVLFEKSFGQVVSKASEAGFVANLSTFAGSRRRLEASFHAPSVSAILNRIKAIGISNPVSEATERVWWPNRFRRVYGEQGMTFLSADDLFSINPSGTKRILLEQVSDRANLDVKAGWLVMARSGQAYGLNVSAMLTTAEHEHQILSDDLIRIIPDTRKIRAGYLLTALTHPTLGRPLVIRNAYGTSIPHLDPIDVSDIPIVRFSEAVEAAIADHAEASAKVRAEAMHWSASWRRMQAISSMHSLPVVSCKA